VNAGVARDVLAGNPGAVRDAVLVNSAAAITAYDLSRGADAAAELDDHLMAGIERAATAIDSGAAAALLDRWAALTRTLGDD
jgi:anthranilate phosphoribosyltransferase